MHQVEFKFIPRQRVQVISGGGKGFKGEIDEIRFGIKRHYLVMGRCEGSPQVTWRLFDEEHLELIEPIE